MNIAFEVNIIYNDNKKILWNPILFINESIIYNRFCYDICSYNKKNLKNINIKSLHKNINIKLYINKSDITYDENSQDIIIYNFILSNDNVYFNIE